VKHQRLLILAGVIGAVALIASLSVAAASSKKPARVLKSTAITAPKVPNAAAIKKKYGGQKITFVGDATSRSQSASRGTPESR
jgi:lipopolysaccharide export LptBFGC system permease protein LptF